VVVSRGQTFPAVGFLSEPLKAARAHTITRLAWKVIRRRPVHMFRVCGRQAGAREESEVIRGRGVCTLAGTPWHQSMGRPRRQVPPIRADPHAHFSNSLLTAALATILIRIYVCVCAASSCNCPHERATLSSAENTRKIDVLLRCHFSIQ
jgi:hypothetical protein